MFNYPHGFQKVFAVSVISIALGACTMSSRPVAATPSSPKPSPPAPSSQPGSPATTPTPAPTPEPEVTCDQTKASWAMGKTADEALVAKVQSDTGAKLVRMLRPGVMVTMEYNGTRVNIRVDNNKKVLAVTCG